IDLLRLLVGGRGLVGRLGIIALGESSRSKDQSRSTHYDRYAEHTVGHRLLKFFVADSDDETDVSWLPGFFRYCVSSSPHSPHHVNPSPSVCPARTTAHASSAWDDVAARLMPQA